jgi:uncharacterized protein YndB with AHSA1/START domain
MSFDITVERLLDTTPEVAFHNWISAEERRLWYTGGKGDWVVEAETDLRVGGAFWITWGPTPDHVWREDGIFEVVDPPHRLVYSNVFTPPPEEGPGGETHLTVTFEPRDGKTLMTIVDRGYPSAEVRDMVLGFYGDGLDNYERSLPAR